MIKIGWILIRIQRKPNFKNGNLKNSENITSHHITYMKKTSQFLSRQPCRKKAQLIKSKIRLDMRVTIRFSFQTPPPGPPWLFVFVFVFKFDSERANVLPNKYLLNLGTTAQYFSVTCIGFRILLDSILLLHIWSNVTRSLVRLLVSIWWFLLLFLVLVSFLWYWSENLMAFFHSKDL